MRYLAFDCNKTGQVERLLGTTDRAYARNGNLVDEEVLFPTPFFDKGYGAQHDAGYGTKLPCKVWKASDDGHNIVVYYPI